MLHLSKPRGASTSLFFYGLVALLVILASAPTSAYAYAYTSYAPNASSGTMCSGTPVTGVFGQDSSGGGPGIISNGPTVYQDPGSDPSGFAANPQDYCLTLKQTTPSGHAQNISWTYQWYSGAGITSGSPTYAGSNTYQYESWTFTAYCTSGANSCGDTNSGTLDSNGYCTVSTPAERPGYGSACSSAPNICGVPGSGTYVCSGSGVACNASAPSNPANLGASCSATSAANACGMTNTNTGSYICSGSGSACSVSAPAAPSNSLCNQPPAAPTFSYVYDNGTAAYDGPSATSYNPSGYRIYMNAVDPNGDNVAIYYYLENSAGTVIAQGWSENAVWSASGGWTYHVDLANAPTGTYYIMAYAEDPSGASSSWSPWQTITLNTPSISGSCSTSASSIYQGQSATWGVSGISGGNGSYTYSWSGTDGLSGSGTSAGQTYTSTGSKTASVLVRSADVSKTINCTIAGGGSSLPVNSCNPTLTPASPTIDLGQTDGLQWSIPSAVCANSCVFSDGHAVSGQSGTYTVTPPAPSSGTTDTYALTCPANSSYTAQAGITVRVPAATISALPNRVHTGDTSTISWTATNVDTCNVTKNGTAWQSNLAADGSRTVTGSAPDVVTAQSVYQISCTNDSGTVVAQATAQAIANLIPSFQQF